MSKAATESLPSRDRTYRWANLIVGFHTTRGFWRHLPPEKYRKAIQYVAAVWADANDNFIPRKKLKRPRWFPKRFVFPDKPSRF